MIRAVAVLVILLVTAGSALAEGFKIVVHPSNRITTLTRSELTAYLLKRQPSWPDGSAVVPVDQPESSAVRAAILREVFQRSASAIKSYWHQQIFSGRAVPPIQKGSDEAVIAFILSSPGAIGYVSESASVGRLTVVAIR